jgi:hypothetical protein
MDADKWSTLPDDLLVDIFRRLDVTTVIRCAGTCRPWRHTIIDNASCFRPRPDRFFPDLLLGFLETHLRRKLQYIRSGVQLNGAFPRAGDRRLRRRQALQRPDFVA